MLPSAKRCPPCARAVSGFGVVFTDVDVEGNAFIEFYARDGSWLGGQVFNAPVWDKGLSFVGVSFNAGERIARAVITSGNNRLQAGNTDNAGGRDIAAMDDFIYGEPRALEQLENKAGLHRLYFLLIANKNRS